MNRKHITALLFATVPSLSMACGCTWVVKAGAANVDPKQYSDATSSFPTIGQLTANDNTQIGLSATFMMNHHLGVEILAASPFNHDISIATSNAGLEGATIGSIDHLPPTATLQFFPLGYTKGFAPYIGAGVNHTLVYNEKVSSAARSLGYDRLSVEDSWGVAAVIGVDFNLSEQWLISASGMVADIGVSAALRDSTGTSATISAEYDLDPWVYRLGLGYKF